MKQTVQVFNDLQYLSHFFGQLVATKMQNTPEDQTFSIAFSGGTTPKVVFEYIASHFNDDIDWEKIRVFWSDERCVAPESKESNFRMAKESLLDEVPIPAICFFRIMGEATDPATEAERYSEVVRRHVPALNNIPQFDLLMLGLGDDGHVASIFPGEIGLFSSAKLFEVAEHPQTKQKRITVTGKVINQARTVVFLATGEAKAAMVATVLEKKAGWQKLPAALVHPENGEALWLLDRYAASQLTNSAEL